MNLSGSRGLVRISHNPTCEVQAALVLTGGDETRLAAQLVATPSRHERRPRLSALQRGLRFERTLLADQAARLRAALAPTLRIAPDDLLVAPLPLPLAPRTPHGRARRVAALEHLLQRWAEAPAQPHLILQPPLRLTWPSLPPLTIIPDALVLRPDHPPLPIEIKSALVGLEPHDHVDRPLMRRQAAIQLVALATTLDGLGLAHAPLHMAGFIAAQPNGFHPTPLIIETLMAEQASVSHALDQLAHLRATVSPALLADLARAASTGALRTTYREWCQHGCALAAWCRTHHIGTVRELGDAASAMVGGDIPLHHIAALLAGTPPATPHEATLVDLLRRVQADLTTGMHAALPDAAPDALSTDPTPTRVRVPRIATKSRPQ